MKRLYTSILCALFALLSITVTAQADNNVNKETFVFAVKGNDTLRLDKYEVLTPVAEAKPCIIFVFGGGFSSGARDTDFNAAYMNKLAQRGYVAVAIDYRLGMNQVQSNPSDSLTFNDMLAFAGMLSNSVNMAVEDLLDATNYVYNHSQQWNINPNQIIANGSSAGAITVLQAEYFISNQLSGMMSRLPSSFNYAAVIAFAGAIYSDMADVTYDDKPSSGLVWNDKPAPIMLFHGDADSNVPFNTLQLGSLGLYGSKYIADQLNGLEYPYYFYEVENVGHEVAGSPMEGNLDDIDSFIQKYVFDQENIQINTVEKRIGQPIKNKKFSVSDFMRSNY